MAISWCCLWLQSLLLSLKVVGCSRQCFRSLGTHGTFTQGYSQRTYRVQHSPTTFGIKIWTQMQLQTFDSILMISISCYSVCLRNSQILQKLVVGSLGRWGLISIFAEALDAAVDSHAFCARLHAGQQLGRGNCGKNM